MTEQLSFEVDVKNITNGWTELLFYLFRIVIVIVIVIILDNTTSVFILMLSLSSSPR